MHSLKRRLSQRWHRTDNEAAVAESCQNENVEEALLTSQATALLPHTESASRAVEDYSTGELHFIVDYVGSAQISEAKSVTRMMETLKRIKKQQIRSIRVNFTIRDGILLVSSVDSNSLILTAPLYAIALCVQEQLRGFDSTFGLNITRKKTHMCHVFQAGSQLEAASIVRTVALAFKAIGKLTREKVERESRRARRTYSVSSSERTRTNSEVSTTSTIGSSSLEHRHPHVKWKHGIESSSGRRSPHGKKYTKSSTSPSILRHPTSTHTSGRHVEFSALSPVPSDGSDSDGKEASALQLKQPLLNCQISVQADIHTYPSTEDEPPIWVKRAEPMRRTSLSDVENDATKASSSKHEPSMRFNHTEEMQPQFSEPIIATENSPPTLSPPIKQKNNFSGDFSGDRKIRKSRKLELQEVPEKNLREYDTSVCIEKEVATENFVVPWTTALLPNETFQKDTVNSPDCLSSNFAKYRGNQPQDMSLPLSDSEGPEDLDAIHDTVAAVQKGETTVVEKFIDSGISVDSHDSARRSLLYYAVSLGDVEMSQFLLKRGADINWEGPDDKSPLHVAASAGNRAVTQLLLGYGANVRAKDNNFCTPLHMSAEHRSKLEVSILLVEHGARIYENNIHGVRPVDLEPELKEMQRLLVQSACEAFAAADITKSRSNSGASSINQGSVSSNVKSKAGVQSPATERVSALRRGLFQHRRSSSLCSISGGHGSPETGRRKHCIKRSESIHIARTLSPLLANSRRGGLMRMHSFHRTTQDQTQTADIHADQTDQKNSADQQLSVVKLTDSLLEGVNVKKDFSRNKRAMESTVEPKETCISSVNTIDTHTANTEEQRMDSALKLNTPVETLEQNTAVVTMHQFPNDVLSSDFQTSPLKQSSDMTGSSEPLHASPEASLLSPFIPKKRSIEKQRPVSDLIQFGENPEAIEDKIGSVEMNKDVVANNLPSEKVQPIEETGEAKGLERQLSNTRQPSLESDQSVSCRRSTSECEDSSFISTGSNYIRDVDPLIDALQPVVHLSGNPECHSSLLAYLCLPKASGQLITLSHMDSGSSLINNHIAVLIGNLFNLEGADSRKRSVEAGLIETVLKLVDSPEPIQSTCLSILQSILDFNNDQEFSTALKTIPLEPLLSLLQISDVDSGAFDLRQTDSPPPYPSASHDRQRYRKRSTCSQSSCDERAREMSPIVQRGSVQRNNSGASDARSDFWPQHGCYVLQKKNSICSVGSSADGDHSFPLYSPGFGHNHLPLMDLHSKTMPRVVATKMLSASSIHPKMQMELGKTRPLSLLLDTLTDGNPEIVIYCVATIANIAMNVDNHMQIDLAGGVDGLKQMLSYGDARVRYHAARGLIYLGYIDVGGVYLFKRVPGDEKLDVLFSESTTGEEHLYVRGATVEKIVEIITNNPSLLWGGLTLPPWSGRSKKHSWYKSSSSGNKHMPSDDHIVDFLLTTYKSYVHPSILMRLLLHRFHDPWFGKYFDGDPSTGQMQDYSPLPVLHIHLMRLWTAWLEKCPEEFVSNPVIASELNEVIHPLRKAGGPYLPCAEILADLIQTLIERERKKHHRDRFQANHCHHAILYEQCQKAVVSGSLPCAVEDSIYLSALQLYIEDLLPVEVRGKQRLFQPSSREKLSVSRIKLSLHPSMYKVKNMGKRIKAQYEQFVTSGMSERNGKHNYIDYCQAMPGYGCQFYKLKECLGTDNPRGGPLRCYLGVSPRKITILDEKTKAVIGTWQSKELKRWRSLAEDTRLRLEFINKTFEFVLENKGVFKEINDALLLCTKVELQILAGQDFSPWSKYAEETEMWGQQALEAVARKPAFYSDKYESDSGVSRLRAISLASSVPDQYAAKVRRHLSTLAKLSSSAPYQQGALQQKCDRDDVMALKTSAEAVLPATGAAISVAGSPGNVSVASHASGDLLLGSLQSTLDPNKGSWEPGSLPTSDQRRPSSKELDACLGSSEASADDSNSPTERHALDSSGSFPVGQDLRNLASSDRRPKYSANSNASSLGSDTPSSGQTTPTYKGPFSSTLRDDDDFESVNRSFGQSSNGLLLICQCPPDAELPGFDRRDFSPFDLLQHPKELARQITLIDHECFCAVSSADIQKKIAMGTGKKRKVPPEERLSVEKVADRFNQLSTWVAATIVTEKSVEKRATMFINFIETAKLCLELRNFNAVMAIVVAALGSAPVRRLHKTKELVPKEVLEQYAKMEILMDTKDNYKRYRQALGSSPTPSVPYFGVYMKDLTFIAEGNPDFFKGGLINLTKRRQIYLVIDEIRRFQKDVYNFQEVSEIRDYLANEKIHTEKELYDISCQFEPGLPRRHSEADKSSISRPVPQFKSSTVGRMAGKRCMSLSRSSTLEAAMPDSTC